jgi:hypothetical protein
MWERLAGRGRSAPSVVSEFERLSALPIPYHLGKSEVDLHEYRLYNAKVNALQGVHREGYLPIEWAAIVHAHAPPQPILRGWREQQAAHAFANFKPTLAEKVFGAEMRRSQLGQDVYAARAADEHKHRAALAAYAADLQRWQWFQATARGVLNGDLSACQLALDHLGPFATFLALGSSLNVLITRSWCVEVWLTGNTNSIVPTLHIDFTSTGKLSRKEMPAARYWALYQDHVCSAALRVAREVFAILPIPITLVHVGYPGINPQTGHADCFPILSVAIERVAFNSLNLHALDPSDSMANFEHRMKYRKSSGFEQIAPLAPGDLAIAEE